jgi:hypothetical protein
MEMLRLWTGPQMAITAPREDMDVWARRVDGAVVVLTFVSLAWGSCVTCRAMVGLN